MSLQVLFRHLPRFVQLWPLESTPPSHSSRSSTSYMTSHLLPTVCLYEHICYLTQKYHSAKWVANRSQCHPAELAFYLPCYHQWMVVDSKQICSKRTDNSLFSFLSHTYVIKKNWMGIHARFNFLPLELIDTTYKYIFHSQLLLPPTWLNQLCHPQQWWELPGFLLNPSGSVPYHSNATIFSNQGNGRMLMRQIFKSAIDAILLQLN